jgi:hypothetical protein
MDAKGSFRLRQHDTLEVIFAWPGENNLHREELHGLHKSYNYNFSEKTMDETPLRRRLGLDESSQAVVDGQGDDTGWQPAPEEQGDQRTMSSVRGVVKELLETAIFILLVFLIVTPLLIALIVRISVSVVVLRLLWMPRVRLGCIGLLLPMLLGQVLVRLVTIFFAPDRLLLLRSDGVSRARVAPLVLWQWRWHNIGVMVPSVPSASLLGPLITPVLTPAGRRIRPPPAEVDRRLPVVAHGDTQDEQRHNLRLH